MASKANEPKYSAAQYERMQAEAPLNQAKAIALAAEFGGGKTARSVAAAAVRKGIAYERKAPMSKTGKPVVRKEDLVSAIGRFVPGSLDGLDKASKPALENILSTFEAMGDED